MSMPKKSITTINKKSLKKKKEINTKPLIIIQLILTIAVMIFAVVTIFVHDLLIWFELLLAITLIDMGINNHFIYRRKYFTAIYLVIGLALVYFFIKGQLGV